MTNLTELDRLVGAEIKSAEWIDENTAILLDTTAGGVKITAWASVPLEVEDTDMSLGVGIEIEDDLERVST